MVESIVVGLGLHLGKKLIDQMWGSARSGKSTVIDSAGTVQSLAKPTKRPKVTHVPGAAPVGLQTLQGRLFVVESLSSTLTGAEKTFVLLIEEMRQEVFALFEVDVSAGFEISLPPSVYSIYALIMDNDDPEFFEATILGIGFPTKEDTAGADTLEWRNAQEMWDAVLDAPIRIGAYGPYSLDLVVLNAAELPDVPTSFAELTGEAEGEICLAGEWTLKEQSEIWSRQATVELVQSGPNLRGIVLNRDLAADGTRWVAQQAVSGEVSGDTFTLHGTRVQVLSGPSRKYNLDCWRGTVRDADTVTGTSRDTAGVRGTFVMTRA